MRGVKIRRAYRSDNEIIRDLKHRMKADFAVPDHRISVEIEGGTVTLVGAVARQADKEAAEACARAVKGVRSVTNLIDVENAANSPLNE